jgi:hypothetical protein
VLPQKWQRWFFVSKNKRQKRRSCLVVLSFEIEVESRGPYTETVEAELSELDDRYYLEDLVEEENFTERY